MSKAKPKEKENLQADNVRLLSLLEIDPFPDNPYRVEKDAAMIDMVDSIREFGVQTPAVVRQKEDGRFELVSGHRRKMACELAGLDAMPCIVREMGRDEAIITLVDSNLQREVILPSEKAKSYKMRLDAMKRQGRRTDLASNGETSSAPLAWKLENGSEASKDESPKPTARGKESAEIIGELAGESKDQVRRYVRLNELMPELLTLVDEGKMAMRPAVEISYIPQEQQALILETIQSEEATPSHAQAIKMRQLAAEGKLDDDTVLAIMMEEKPNQVEQFKIPKDRISRFFKQGTSDERIQDIIVKALEFYQKHKERQSKEERKDAR